jgi:hypothetical protein
MYMDKLDGRITQKFFDRQSAAWCLDQDGLQHKIQDVQKAALAPIDYAIDMLRPTSRASELFLQQTAAEQRRLLQAVVEKAAWQGGALRTTLFEPFEILRHSNQESYRKEKENGGSGRDMRIWLPIGLEPNPPVTRPRRSLESEFHDAGGPPQRPASSAAKRRSPP